MLATLVVVATPWALAQQSQPDSQVPEDAFTARQLIAWSGLQKPQPAPQPLPPSDAPIPQPDQPTDQQATAPGHPHGEQRPSESFTAKIVKEGTRYCLRSGSKTYQLSGQDDLQKYENQPVRVLGTFDSSTDTIRIAQIVLLS